MDRILIIEDDRFFREVFSDLLKGEGYEVDCASDGLEGLRMVAEQPYALVITDLVMPDISGMEVLSRVRESDPTIDVIMVTGNANLESAIFALKHGARDYLVKPVNPDEFRHAVAQCLEQRRLLDENEELRNMLNLFQASQAIAGCLDLGRVYHLLVDTIAREVGVGRAIGVFQEDGRLDVQEVKGVSSGAAAYYRDAMLACVFKHLPHKHLMNRVRLPAAPEALAEGDGGIKEAYLIFVRSRDTLQGIIVLFNDAECRLPDVRPKKKNILFLLEQATLAFENAETYSLAKDMLFIDDLSGLYNYRYLEVALDRELKRVERYASQLSVLFLDVDSFKQVNDTYGHLVGSQVLREMGALLKKSVREVDVVIRYGGDEYTIILVETNCKTAGIVAERIRKLVESHVFLASEGYNLRLTCSIGYSCCPEDTILKQDLLEMADKAMYAGKNSGRNCVKRFSAPS
ncbi:MAG TPA: diguanylate cyclase [Desulfuromonadaceae bacterium]